MRTLPNQNRCAVSGEFSCIPRVRIKDSLVKAHPFSPQSLPHCTLQAILFASVSLGLGLEKVMVDELQILANNYLDIVCGGLDHQACEVLVKVCIPFHRSMHQNALSKLPSSPV